MILQLRNVYNYMVAILVTGVHKYRAPGHPADWILYRDAWCVWVLTVKRVSRHPLGA
jgi:hypothetical protein